VAEDQLAINGFPVVPEEEAIAAAAGKDRKLRIRFYPYAIS
jgi:hypothetical protein